METDLTKLTEGSSLLPSEEEVRGLSESPGFVPSIKLLQGTSNEIANEGNKAGDFYHATEQINLTDKVLILVFSRRSHALLLRGREKEAESFIFGSQTFKKIKATQPDQSQGITVMWGFGDWLLWLPEYEMFVSYFCGKKSSQPISTVIKDCMQPPNLRQTEIAKSKPHTPLFQLWSKFETEKFGKDRKCYVPQVTPLDPKEHSEINTPTQGQIETMINIFQAPVLQEQQVEVVPNAPNEDVER